MNIPKVTKEGSSMKDVEPIYVEDSLWWEESITPPRFKIPIIEEKEYENIHRLKRQSSNCRLLRVKQLCGKLNLKHEERESSLFKSTNK